MVLCTMQYVPDADDPHAIIARLMDAAPSGSFLTVPMPQWHPDPGSGSGEVIPMYAAMGRKPREPGT